MEFYKCPVVPLQLTQLKFSSIDVYLNHLLGEGVYSTCYRAKCDLLPCVAKVIKIDGATEGEVLRIEIACQLLSAIKHPNIVQYLGTARQGFENRPIVILEEMEESLSQFLERHCTEQMEVPFYVKVNILCDVAVGLAYLHNIDFIHGSLTGNNVLMSGESRAKVSDFWVHKIVDTHPAMQSRNTDPQKIPYMAPEALSHPPVFTQLSDTYSFGAITVQVDTQETPKSDQRAEPCKISTSKMKSDSLFVKIALECLVIDPSERPGLERLCRDLSSLKNGDAYTTNKQRSRGECERLRHHLSDKSKELQELSTKLQARSEEAATMKMVVTKLEQQVLCTSRENKKLEKKNAEHENFEKHLIMDSAATSGYRGQFETDEPDSTSDYNEVQEVSSYSQ